ncbi:MAG: histidine kinase [Arachidicoccus sp.]|nr:histidine kinase [Arachidicoccus sp.]
MRQPLNKKIILYSSLFITAVICFPPLLRQQTNSLRNILIPFNWDEWVFHIIIEFCFCASIFYINKKYIGLFQNKWIIFKDIRITLLNIGVLLLFSVIGGGISRVFIQNTPFPLNGYLLRFSITLFFILIEIKIISTLYYASQKEKENEQLRSTNARMELEILKEQINPHFLFNTLSSLSSIIRENPAKAQEFVSHLSKIFRYSLSNKNQHLVTLGEELEKLNSYIELMQMRMEQGLRLINNIPKDFYERLLPQTSLLPLIENALKHNTASSEKPLIVRMSVDKDDVIISNNLQLKAFPEPGNGIGLTNLNERFRILRQTEITIVKTDNLFTVKLPLKK